MNLKKIHNNTNNFYKNTTKFNEYKNKLYHKNLDIKMKK